MLDVYIGFMDEEVAGMLNCVVDQTIQQQRPLLIFERGEVENLLFERHLSSYGQQFTKLVVNGPPVSEDDWTATLTENIKRSFDEKIFKKFQQRTHNCVKQKVVLKNPGTGTDLPTFLFSVMGLNTEKSNSKDAMVVIRSPEMGFQPDLTRTYLRAVIRSLQNLPGAKEGVNFNIFGAGGAIGAEHVPGTVHHLTGSLFVGSGIVKDDGNPKPTYKGTVRFVGFQDGTSNRGRQFTEAIGFESAPLADKEQAERQAKAAFALLCGNRERAREMMAPGESLSQVEAKLNKDAMKAIPASGTAKTSLTASFFIGAKIKDLARGLDLYDANMEDYHILKILKSVHEKETKFGGIRLEKIRMLRVDCDPPIIKEEQVKSFSEWLKRARYSSEQYIAAIKLGLYGMQLPGNDCGPERPGRRMLNKEIAELIKLFEWDWATQRIEKQQEEKKLFYEYQNNESKLKVILDPLGIEIATDFLTDLISGRAFGASEITRNLSEKLKSNARLLRRAHANSLGNRLPPFVEGLIEELVRGLLALKAFIDKENPEKFIIWVRPQSWNGNRGCLSTELTVDESTLDRAFYKSANQAALQAHAKLVVGD